MNCFWRKVKAFSAALKLSNDAQFFDQFPGIPQVALLVIFDL
jgi:hypothetical protein